MGKRTFRELASGSAGASTAIAPLSTTSVPRTTSAPSTTPDLALNITSVPSPTPVPSTASVAKKTARMPSSVVLGMPASDPKAARSSVPLSSSCSEEGQRKAARDHNLVFDDDAAVAHLFATMVLPDDPYTRVRASSSGTMSRAGLKFLVFVNRVGHELEAEIEKQKRRADNYAKGDLAAKTERNKYAEQLEKKNKELERALGDNKRLRVENEKLAKKLETTKRDASNSLDCLTRRNEQVGELKKQVGQKRELRKTAKAVIVGLHEKFAIVKAKFVELNGDPKVPRLEDELASLSADVEANVGDEEYFDKLMESLRECLDVVLLEEMRIDSVGLLKNLMISEDGRMFFAGEDEAEVNTVAAEDMEAEKTRTGGDAAKIEKTGADDDGAEKAVLEMAGLTTLVTSSESAKDEEAHP
ncbi:hypothetical protein AALP_AAs73563U000100 [Arabis alpina]|uniref:Uncharacterized protein n=1 Tax=Arabis alpina TaxID=50452 RepID=A0A087FXP9_ARAAL|nr:hypothetical protein AALP_AAs73563U000100 [Arabis alpina]